MIRTEKLIRTDFRDFDLKNQKNENLAAAETVKRREKRV